jgi:hypothetical protein
MKPFHELLPALGREVILRVDQTAAIALLVIQRPRDSGFCEINNGELAKKESSI